MSLLSSYQVKNLSINEFRGMNSVKFSNKCVVLKMPNPQAFLASAKHMVKICGSKS